MMGLRKRGLMRIAERMVYDGGVEVETVPVLRMYDGVQEKTTVDY